MNKRKKIISSILLVMVMVMCMTYCNPVMAAGAEKETAIEIPVVTADKDLSTAEIGKIFPDTTTTNSNQITTVSAPTVINAAIVRNGDSEECQVYISWNGSDL